ncbi:Uncharacterised protein [Mycobacterium tuberculosis]|uniref:Uncharacterized protein n=1 Tax=Mycobacterium tuberculosis TaxID=1773 RepID=A0A916LFE6_MYCTX|nr:Uncharacterised protein [Mycobacterium tuberculosis]
MQPDVEQKLVKGAVQKRRVHRDNGMGSRGS